MLEVRARELVAKAEARQVRGGGRKGGLCRRGGEQVVALSIVLQKGNAGLGAKELVAEAEARQVRGTGGGWADGGCRTGTGGCTVEKDQVKQF